MDLQVNEFSTGNTAKERRPRWKLALYVLGCVILVSALAVGIIVTFFPNTVLEYAIEPKLKQLISDRLGKQYALKLDSIFFSKGKDSLFIVGVHINEGDSSNAGLQLPLERMSTDTIVVAGLDYWKLILQKGLFADNITIRSPKIYLRPGALPRFEENFFPAFLPVVSSQTIKLDNAQLFFSDKTNTLHMGNGVTIEKASVIFKDFYLDEAALKKANSTFFCKSATFIAENISHLDSVGEVNLRIAKASGDLIDSTLEVSTIEYVHPIPEMPKLTIHSISAVGTNWTNALAGKGLQIRIADIDKPSVEIEELAKLQTTKNTIKQFEAKGLIPMPSLVPCITVRSLNVRNAELKAQLPNIKQQTTIGPLNATLTDLSLDDKCKLSNISSFYSKRAEFSIASPTTLNTSYGTVSIGSVTGTSEFMKASKIRFRPSLKSVRTSIDQFSLASAQIFGLDLWKLFNRQGFEAKNVVLAEPAMYLRSQQSDSSSDMKAILGINPLLMLRDTKVFPLPELIPSASIGTLSIEQGAIYGIHWLDNSKSPLSPGDSLKKISLTLQQINLNKTTWLTKRQTLFASTGSFSVGTFSHDPNGTNYGFHISSLKGDLAAQSLSIGSILIKPGVKPAEYCDSFSVRKEYIGVAVPSININGLDYGKLFLGEGVFAKLVACNNWDLTIYGDKRKPEAPQQYETYPHEFFQYVKMPLGIQTVTIRNGGILYTEHWPDVDAPAQITIDTINATIGVISNQIPTDSSALIDGTLQIMGQAPVSYKIAYQLNNPQFNLEMIAKAGEADASLFNNFLGKIEPFTLSGNVHSIEFGLAIKDSEVVGKIVPIYDSLNVSFYRWDKFPPGLFSWLANSIFMRTENIYDGTEPPKIGDINATLDRQTNIFWSLWHPIRSGLSSVVRIPEWVW